MATTQALTTREDNAVAVTSRHSQVTEVQRLGGLLAASGYFSDARDMAQAAVKVMAGEELGIPPVAAMMGINIIKGKIALGGNLIASRIRAHGYDYRHKHFDATACVLEFLSKPDASGKRVILGESSFTMEDAKAAGVTANDTYKKYPRNMLFNRAISNGARWYTPEVFAGAPVYVPEELGANVDENGEMVHPEPTKAEQAAARDAVRDRKLAEIRQQQAQPLPPTAAPLNVQTAPAAPEVHDAEVVEEAQPEPLPPQETQQTAAANIKARLEQFSRIKGMIGPEAYYRILGAHGYEHANDPGITLNVARAIYREMAACFDEMQRRAAQ